jgi:hypothetical protein
VEYIHWFTQIVKHLDNARIYDELEKLFMERYVKETMLIIIAPLDVNSYKFFLGASSENQVLPHYLNFTSPGEDKLPKEASLLIGEATLFEKWFKYHPKPI